MTGQDGEWEGANQVSDPNVPTTSTSARIRGCGQGLGGGGSWPGSHLSAWAPPSVMLDQLSWLVAGS